MARSIRKLELLDKYSSFDELGSKLCEMIYLFDYFPLFI